MVNDSHQIAHDGEYESGEYPAKAAYAAATFVISVPRISMNSPTYGAMHRCLDFQQHIITYVLVAS